MSFLTTSLPLLFNFLDKSFTRIEPFIFTVFFDFSFEGSEFFLSKMGFLTDSFFSSGFGFSTGLDVSFCGSSSLGTSTFFSETIESFALLMWARSFCLSSVETESSKLV